MSARVSVIVQSHARPLTMPIAAASVLAQTVRELELILVLDGPVDGLRAAADALAAADPRVRVLERPKGRRHGEETKAEAVAGAASDVIAYCCDDDLWLPWHLETLLPHVAGDGPALAHAPCVQVLAGGGLRVLPFDVAEARYRHLLLEGENRFGPTHTVHTRSALDGTSGWAVPDDGPADLWLWRQVVVRPDVRLTTVPRLTTLSFPTPFRRAVPDRSGPRSSPRGPSAWRHPGEPSRSCRTPSPRPRPRRRGTSCGAGASPATPSGASRSTSCTASSGARARAATS